LIVTSKDGDLITYGILTNDTKIFKPAHTNPLHAIAVCENQKSTIIYRSIFDLTQSQDKVTFSGLLRTSTKMEDDDELIISLN
jgi:hypothetical protein